ncbi:hypothetical protein RvY_16076 [Ramazzottius varieornatus]|uniref:Uncharacterized protein n=1 Tax=Ramazzottius varieornatus TaxID=947166 RepID=A0A1D1VX65_RAMVA|nr:hypothetical protein RvY_16076 [Ramazzottius varieornatus]
MSKTEEDRHQALLTARFVIDWSQACDGEKALYSPSQTIGRSTWCLAMMGRQSNMLMPDGTKGVTGASTAEEIVDYIITYDGKPQYASYSSPFLLTYGDAYGVYLGYPKALKLQADVEYTETKKE